MLKQEDIGRAADWCKERATKINDAYPYKDRDEMDMKGLEYLCLVMQVSMSFEEPVKSADGKPFSDMRALQCAYVLGVARGMEVGGE